MGGKTKQQAQRRLVKLGLLEVLTLALALILTLP